MVALASDEVKGDGVLAALCQHAQGRQQLACEICIFSEPGRRHRRVYSQRVCM